MFEVGPAVIAGLFGGLFTFLITYFGVWLAPNRFRVNVLRTLGTIVADENRLQTYGTGLAAYVALSIVLGLIYAAVLSVTGQAGSLGIGALVGVAGWAILGIGLGLSAERHPLVSSGEFAAPGYFAINNPRETVVGLLALSAFYGLFVSWFYGGLTGVLAPVIT